MADTSSSNTEGTPPVLALLDNIVADTNAALVQSSVTEAGVVANLGVAEQIAGQLGDLNMQAAKDRALVTATQQAGELKAQQYTLRAANAAGINPTRASDALLDNISKFQESTRTLDTAVTEQRRMKDSSIFDDPIQFVKDLISLPGQNRQVQRAGQDVQRYAGTINAITGVVAQAHNSSLQIKESVTAASADAATRLAANESMQAAGRSALEGLKYNTEALNASMNMSKERLSLMYNKQSVDMAKRNQEIVLAKFANEKEEFDWNKNQKLAALEAKAEGKGIDDYVLERINVGRASRGVAPLTGMGAKTNLLLFKNGGSKELTNDYQQGERTSQTGVPMLGATPAEALENISEHPTEIVGGRERAVSILAKAKQALMADPLLAGSKDKKAQDAFINTYVAGEVARQYQNVTGGGGNMFDVGDLTSYFGIQSINAEPIVSKILKPAAEAGVKLDNYKTVMSMGVAAVQKKAITSDEFVSGMSHIYQRANLINQQAANPIGLGFQLPNGGRNLYVKLNVFGGPIDITNPTELGRYLSKELASSMSGNPSRKLTGRSGIPFDSTVRPFRVEDYVTD